MSWSSSGSWPPGIRARSPALADQKVYARLVRGCARGSLDRQSFACAASQGANLDAAPGTVIAGGLFTVVPVKLAPRRQRLAEVR